ncbi:MAG: DUF2252 family protein [Bacteroidota bacterium]
MDIKKSTTLYEDWMGKQTNINSKRLSLKHERMKECAFNFFRGSFYHWAQLWAEQEVHYPLFPKALSVADIHYENFGTWRDAEARLVWGINDFDEAYELPFMHDLVRLACSVHLGIESDMIRMKHGAANKALLDGYQYALTSGTKPFVLEEHHTWLRKIATRKLHNPKIFWERLFTNNVVHPPEEIQQLLTKNFPSLSSPPVFLERIAGLGSLGRPRYIAIAEYNGGYICREAKATVPSACAWVYHTHPNTHFYHEMIQQKAVRNSSLFLTFQGGWQIKKLSPDHSRIELKDLPKSRKEEKILFAMGFELANIHASNEDIAHALLASLQQLPEKWFEQVVKMLTQQMKKDYNVFCKNF